MLYLSCSKLISIFRLANFCQFFDRKFLSVLPFTKKLLMIRCSQGATMAIGGAIIRVGGKKFFVGVGCGVWGVGCGVWDFTDFQGKSQNFASHKVFRFNQPTLIKKNTRLF